MQVGVGGYLWKCFVVMYVVCFEGEFPVLQSGEDVLTTSSKIMDYLREKVCIGELQRFH